MEKKKLEKITEIREELFSSMEKLLDGEMSADEAKKIVQESDEKLKKWKQIP